MTTLENEMIINAPLEKIWTALTEVEKLDQFDPTVKKSTATTSEKSGIGAARKVDMKDGKNWFEEKVTVYKPNESLEYELTACSFPIHNLKHSYSFEKIGDQVKVKQTMQYQMKFGFLGKIMDALMVRKKSDSGIKQFFSGLKKYAEKA
jgi:ribosome-associated toxin RatA of RatAB toxin-antitoxin module